MATPSSSDSKRRRREDGGDDDDQDDKEDVDVVDQSVAVVNDDNDKEKQSSHDNDNNNDNNDIDIDNDNTLLLSVDLRWEVVYDAKQDGFLSAADERLEWYSSRITDLITPLDEPNYAKVTPAVLARQRGLNYKLRTRHAKDTKFAVRSGDLVKIHFKGWSLQTDEWIVFKVGGYVCLRDRELDAKEDEEAAQQRARGEEPAAPVEPRLRRQCFCMDHYDKAEYEAYVAGLPPVQPRDLPLLPRTSVAPRASTSSTSSSSKRPTQQQQRGGGQEEEEDSGSGGGGGGDDEDSRPPQRRTSPRAPPSVAAPSPLTTIAGLPTSTRPARAAKPVFALFPAVDDATPAPAVEPPHANGSQEEDEKVSTGRPARAEDQQMLQEQISREEAAGFSLPVAPASSSSASSAVPADLSQVFALDLQSGRPTKAAKLLDDEARARDISLHKLLSKVMGMDSQVKSARRWINGETLHRTRVVRAGAVVCEWLAAKQEQRQPRRIAPVDPNAVAEYLRAHADVAKRVNATAPGARGSSSGMQQEKEEEEEEEAQRYKHFPAPEEVTVQRRSTLRATPAAVAVAPTPPPLPEKTTKKKKAVPAPQALPSSSSEEEDEEEEEEEAKTATSSRKKEPRASAAAATTAAGARQPRSAKPTTTTTSSSSSSSGKAAAVAAAMLSLASSSSSSSAPASTARFKSLVRFARTAAVSPSTQHEFVSASLVLGGENEAAEGFSLPYGLFATKEDAQAAEKRARASVEKRFGEIDRKASKDDKEEKQQGSCALCHRPQLPTTSARPLCAECECELLTAAQSSCPSNSLLGSVPSAATATDDTDDNAAAASHATYHHYAAYDLDRQPLSTAYWRGRAFPTAPNRIAERRTFFTQLAFREEDVRSQYGQFRVLDHVLMSRRCEFDEEVEQEQKNSPDYFVGQIEAMWEEDDASAAFAAASSGGGGKKKKKSAAAAASAKRKMCRINWFYWPEEADAQMSSYATVGDGLELYTSSEVDVEPVHHLLAKTRVLCWDEFNARRLSANANAGAGEGGLRTVRLDWPPPPAAEKEKVVEKEKAEEKAMLVEQEKAVPAATPAVVPAAPAVVPASATEHVMVVPASSAPQQETAAAETAQAIEDKAAEDRSMAEAPGLAMLAAMTAEHEQPPPLPPAAAPTAPLVMPPLQPASSPPPPPPHEDNNNQMDVVVEPSPALPPPPPAAAPAAASASASKRSRNNRPPAVTTMVGSVQLRACKRCGMFGFTSPSELSAHTTRFCGADSVDSLQRRRMENGRDVLTGVYAPKEPTIVCDPVLVVASPAPSSATAAAAPLTWQQLAEQQLLQDEYVDAAVVRRALTRANAGGFFAKHHYHQRQNRVVTTEAGSGGGVNELQASLLFATDAAKAEEDGYWPSRPAPAFSCLDSLPTTTSTPAASKCSFCHRALVPELDVAFECQVCPGRVTLCLPCMSKGRQQGQHRQSHPYLVSQSSLDPASSSSSSTSAQQLLQQRVPPGVQVQYELVEITRLPLGRPRFRFGATLVSSTSGAVVFSVCADELGLSYQQAKDQCALTCLRMLCGSANAYSFPVLAFEWQAWEAAKLMDGLAQHGLAWETVAPIVGTKTPTECRDYYAQHFLNHTATTTTAASSTVVVELASREGREELGEYDLTVPSLVLDDCDGFVSRVEAFYAKRQAGRRNLLGMLQGLIHAAAPNRQPRTPACCAVAADASSPLLTCLTCYDVFHSACLVRAEDRESQVRGAGVLEWHCASCLEDERYVLEHHAWGEAGRVVCELSNKDEDVSAKWRRNGECIREVTLAHEAVGGAGAEAAAKKQQPPATQQQQQPGGGEPTTLLQKELADPFVAICRDTVLSLQRALHMVTQQRDELLKMEEDQQQQRRSSNKRQREEEEEDPSAS